MKYGWLDEYLLSKSGAEKDYKVEWGWHRYMVRGKLFAAVCAPGPEHKAPYAGHELVNLKCDPRLAEGFREQYPEVEPGFYCDKRTPPKLFHSPLGRWKGTAFPPPGKCPPWAKCQGVRVVLPCGNLHP